MLVQLHWLLTVVVLLHQLLEDHHEQKTTHVVRMMQEIVEGQIILLSMLGVDHDRLALTPNETIASNYL